MLSQYRHDNIVSLLGFCDDCGEKILVYDYASKRSLDFYLNDEDLTWVQRLEICIGAARGLAYLHNPADIVYDNIKDEINPHSLKAFTTIAYQCLNRDQEQRPLMTEVVKELESALKCQVSNEPPTSSLSRTLRASTKVVYEK
nr:protein kinase, ATP binding site-containing protein [Tanacetum cinerariifolium]